MYKKSFSVKRILKSALLSSALCSAGYSIAEALPVAPIISPVGHHFHKRYKGSFPHHEATAAYKPLIDTSQDTRLVSVASSNHIWSGVTTTRDGRIFVIFPQVENGSLQLAELSSNGALIPFPSAGWNNPPNNDSHAGFIHVSSARIGPDGALWVLDSGVKTGIYNLDNDMPVQRIPGAARLFRFDINNSAPNQPIHYDIIDFTDFTSSISSLTNFRFNGKYIYLTDSGDPALLVFNTENKDTWRTLERINHTMCKPVGIGIGGRQFSDINKNISVLGVKELEVSPNGKTLYFQTACGPMYKIDTKWLSDDYDDDERMNHIEKFADTPFTGGTAIDSAGNIFISDVSNNSIVKYTPDRMSTVFIQDPRLEWVANMWIDSHGSLWMPASQLGGTPFLNNGQNRVNYPVQLYKMQIGSMPAANDHP